MISIKDKSQCCGCGACAQRCPKSCITMSDDEQGFLYAKVDEGSCVNCCLCEKVCPMLNPGEPRKPLATYAAIHRDEKIRLASSSGGVFTALAEYIIKQGGVVFGARFNDKWDVIHDWTETIEGVAAFRGSKYVQSEIGDNYIKAERFLKQGRQVLFTGTPCQIAGLKRFLRKDYDNLLAVEVACHGVPSPLVWHSYVKSIQHNRKLHFLSFRDKSNGWKRFNFKAKFDQTSIHEPFDENIYMKGFLYNLYLRPSCYDCKFKSLKSLSDLLIADFWGISLINRNLDDDKGVSLVLANSINAKLLLEHLNVSTFLVDYSEVLPYNTALISSVTKNKYYNMFWQKHSELGFLAVQKVFNRKPSIIHRIYYKLKELL